MSGENETESVDALKQRIKELEDQLAGGVQGRVRNESYADLHHPRPRDDPNKIISFVVLGASGDLAKKKTFPALFHVFEAGLLPDKFQIVGYARSKMDLAAFREKISEHIKPKEEAKLQKFLELCSYFQGQYTDSDAFSELDEYLKSKEDGPANRLFYLALPPTVFVDVSRSIQPAAMSRTGWNRVIIEKPFGHDYDSAKKLGRQLGEIFEEHQMYRIDHYLGKKLVQNILTLRFANIVLEPLWKRESIKSVTISFKEPHGTEGRGGYFDEFGIIRDVAQNHLMQVLSLICMDSPSSLQPDDIRDAKVKVLRQIDEIKLEDVVLGQYGASEDGSKPSYLDDDSLENKESNTPTFATMVLYVKNERWAGVPFIIKCGKALDERKMDVRVQFRRPQNFLFDEKDSQSNELVMRVQPDEAIYMKLMVKKPGLTSERVMSELDLSFKDRYQITRLPDAYEVLILEAIKGKHTLFVRDDELLEAWRIFTPLLNEIEKEGSSVKPIIYPYGSRGPKEADELRKRVGFSQSTKYSWSKSKPKL